MSFPGAMISAIGASVSNATTQAIVAAKGRGALSAVDALTPPRRRSWRRILRRFCMAIGFIALVGVALGIFFAITMFFANRYGDTGFFVGFFGQVILLGAAFYAFFFED